jgi:hypothetical protein
LKIKVEVEISGEPVVNNIHGIISLVYKSKFFLIIPIKYLKKEKIFHKGLFPSLPVFGREGSEVCKNVPFILIYLTNSFSV